MIVSSLSCNFNRCAVCFQSFSEHRCGSTQNAARSLNHLVKNKLKKFFIMLERNSIYVHSNTRLSARTAKVRTGWPYRWFWKFFNGLAKSPRVLRSSWILKECNLYCKIVKYCILSEVCMIKTVPLSTVSPHMWCINGMKGWFTRTQICWQDFVK